MSNLGRSLIFHPATTALLWVSLIAVVVLGYHVLPMIDIDFKYRAVEAAYPVTFIPLFLWLVASLMVAVTILAWRAWALYIRAWWRSTGT